jgi:hypothetical protein
MKNILKFIQKLLAPKVDKDAVGQINWNNKNWKD